MAIVTVIFAGAAGTGKTVLANALASAASEAGMKALHIFERDGGDRLTISTTSGGISSLAKRDAGRMPACRAGSNG